MIIRRVPDPWAQWDEDERGDRDLADELWTEHSFLSRVWAVGRLTPTADGWSVSPSSWHPTAEDAWSVTVVALEDLVELLTIIDDDHLRAAVDIALERLDRRGVRREGDAVAVGSVVWMYWPELCTALDPHDAAAWLTERFGDR